MKVGLIARSNDRGLGTQTYEAWRGYPFHSVLHVLDDNKRWPEKPDLYPGAHIAHFGPDGIDPGVLTEFMVGLDVIFSVETLYDWRIVHMARNRGIRTIVQGNPEFMRHDSPAWEETPHPTIWCWPTPWMIDRMPPGPVVPVPVPVDCPVKAGDIDAPLVVVHVAGHRAKGDRNGTEFVLEGLRLIQRPVTLRLIGQDGPNTIFREREIPIPDNVTFEMCETGVADRWSMYDGAHIALLPRRYGGLCLPAIEAMRAGVVPFMPNCSPNDIWPIVPLEWRPGRSELTPFGHVDCASVPAMTMARRIDDFEKERSLLAMARDAVAVWVEENTWERLRPVYDRLFSDRP